MNIKIRPLRTLKTRQAITWVWLGFGLLLPHGAHAACAVNMPAATVDFGRALYSAGADFEVSGYRVLGSPKTILVSVSCDADRDAVNFGITNVMTLERGLLRWDSGRTGGAIRLRAIRATADGVQVNFLTSNGDKRAVLDVVKDGDLVGLDLSSVRNRGRNFIVEWQVTGLVDKSFIPNANTSFSISPRLSLLP